MWKSLLAQEIQETLLIFFKILKKIDDHESGLYCIIENVRSTSPKEYFFFPGGQFMSQEKYIMAIDQGTTSSRAIIFNKKGEKVKSSRKFSLKLVGLNTIQMKSGTLFSLLSLVPLSRVASNQDKSKLSELPTNGKQPLFGIRILDFQSTMPLSGSLAKLLL